MASAGRLAESIASINALETRPAFVLHTGEEASGLLRRFGSVTVLNGHIHQVLQKVEGTATFHSARSTAFPQPAPGAAPTPGPMAVEADELRRLLGVREVRYTEATARLAVVERPLT